MKVRDVIGLNMFPNEVTINFNVFSSFVETMTYFFVFQEMGESPGNIT